MATLNGTNSNDFILGTVDSDTINGFAGDDLINGLGGNDVLIGGFGNNILNGAGGINTASYAEFGNNVNASLETQKATFFGGNDTLFSIQNLVGGNNGDILTGDGGANIIDGGFGSDLIFGRAGDDRLLGSAGRDTLRGEIGNDVLLGGDGVDLLEGGDGGDSLRGDKDNDTMIGGNGDDQFTWVDGDGSDLIQGDSGNDTVVFNGSFTQGDQITLSQVGTDILLQRTNLTAVTLKTQGIENFNAINGLGGDDRLIVSNLNAGSGVSFIQFTGGDGNDSLLVNSTSVVFNTGGGRGNDTLSGGNGNDSLFGDEGNDFLAGGVGNDTLEGARISNLGRGEVDVLIGGAGRDTFVLNNFYDDGNNLTDGDIRNLGDGIDGTGDFARIIGFSDDLIRLSGPRSNYELKTISNSLAQGSSTPDVGIFKKTGSLHPLELIGIVQDAPTTLNLDNITQFSFI
ncbi:MAG: calcium-binding protein [Nostoc sp. DedQUE12a]|nr:calcium-binding protein [Nostoc sp. DedQUE12a]